MCQVEKIGTMVLLICFRFCDMACFGEEMVKKPARPGTEPSGGIAVVVIRW